MAGTPTLILPVGPPGCGKSTLAAVLVEMGLPPTAVISPDAYRLVATGDRANQDANVLVFGVCHALVRSRLRFGLTVYFDATNYKSLSELSNMAEVSEARILTIKFDVDYSQLLLRNAKRANPVPESVLERMYQEFLAVPESSYPGTVISPLVAMEGWWTAA